MPTVSEKLARMKNLAESIGIAQVAPKPSYRPLDMNRLRAMQARSEESVAQEL